MWVVVPALREQVHANGMLSLLLFVVVCCCLLLFVVVDVDVVIAEDNDRSLHVSVVEARGTTTMTLQYFLNVRMGD